MDDFFAAVGVLHGQIECRLVEGAGAGFHAPAFRRVGVGLLQFDKLGKVVDVLEGLFELWRGCTCVTGVWPLRRPDFEDLAGIKRFATWQRKQQFSGRPEKAVLRDVMRLRGRLR